MDKPTNKHNDHPHDANNNSDDDVDGFPQQNKQSVPPQDISPTNTFPSLIVEYLTDKSTNTCCSSSNKGGTKQIYNNGTHTQRYVTTPHVQCATTTISL